MADYRFDPTNAQNSIATKIEADFPLLPVIEDGLLDAEHDKIKFDRSGKVKPFAVLWFGDPFLNPVGGQSFKSEKLHGYLAPVDLVIVSADPTESRRVLNGVANQLMGWKPTNAGEMQRRSGLWSGSGKVEIENRPTRFAATTRFVFSPQANHVL